jgi:hypothetical protein
MLKFLFSIAIVATIISCGTTNSFKKDEASFNASKVVTQYKAIGDLNDSYFSIKENNYFEFYMQLFDSIKNTSYPGKFTLQGDTMLLNFYNTKAKAILGTKAYIDKAKKEIVFFDQLIGVKRRFLFN